MSADCEISIEDAQSYWSLIAQTQQQMRKSMASGAASGLLMLWGLVWFFAFLGCWFFPRQSVWVWAGSNTAGIVGMAAIFWLGRKDVRAKSAVSKKLGWRLFWFWFLLFVYGDVFLVLLWTPQGIKISQMAAFVCALIMFAYVVLGLWIDANFMVALGLSVTVLIVVGYLFLRQYFNLWMAPAGGGALFLTGLYIRLKWR